VNPNQRPLSITILAGVYILVGAMGFFYHFRQTLPLHRDGALILVTELLAFVAGVFLLRGRNWARWLALAWMGFHVILTAFVPLVPFLMHCVFLAAIAWILLRPPARQYFRGASLKPV
jgi:hypothetical protein